MRDCNTYPRVSWGVLYIHVILSFHAAPACAFLIVAPGIDTRSIPLSSPLAMSQSSRVLFRQLLRGNLFRPLYSIFPIRKLRVACLYTPSRFGHGNDKTDTGKESSKIQSRTNMAPAKSPQSLQLFKDKASIKRRWEKKGWLYEGAPAQISCRRCRRVFVILY